MVTGAKSLRQHLEVIADRLSAQKGHALGAFAFGDDDVIDFPARPALDLLLHRFLCGYPLLLNLNWSTNKAVRDLPSLNICLQ